MIHTASPISPASARSLLCLSLQLILFNLQHSQIFSSIPHQDLASASNHAFWQFDLDHFITSMYNLPFSWMMSSSSRNGSYQTRASIYIRSFIFMSWSSCARESSASWAWDYDNRWRSCEKRCEQLNGLARSSRCLWMFCLKIWGFLGLMILFETYRDCCIWNLAGS